MIQIVTHYNGTFEVFREPEGSDKLVRVVPKGGAKVKLYQADRQRGAQWSQVRQMSLEGPCILQIQVTGLALYKHYLYVPKDGHHVLQFANDEGALMARLTIQQSKDKDKSWMRLAKSVKVSLLEYKTRFGRDLFEEDDEPFALPLEEPPPLPEVVTPPPTPQVEPPAPLPTVDAALAAVAPTTKKGRLEALEVEFRATLDSVLEAFFKRED